MNLSVITLVLALVFWQGAAPTPTPPARKASADIQARILKLQLTAARIQSAYQSCQSQDFQGQFNRTQLEVQEAVNDAFKESKLDKKDYDLSLETFEFVKHVPTPPATVPAPAAPAKP